MRIEPVDITKPTWAYRRGSEEVRLPASVTAHEDDGAFDYDISFTAVPDEEGVPACTELTVRQRTGGPAVTSASLRDIPLAGLVRDAMTKASIRFAVTTDDDGREVLTLDALDPSNVAPEQVKPFYKRGQKPRRNAVADTVLKDAVRLYADAKADERKNPLSWVGDQLGVSRSTAALYVKQAKDRGIQ